MKIAVLGATAGTGPCVVRRLQADGHVVVAAGRNTGRLRDLEPDAETVAFDLSRPASVTGAIGDANAVVSLVHARHAGGILAALPPHCRRLVVTGSTRAFTRFPDPTAEAVRRAEAMVRACAAPAVMLHPTMIYGSGRDRNVGRIVELAARWPRALPVVVPLPGDGRNLVQPILVDDFAAAVSAALAAADPPRTLVVAGPEPLTFADMVRACAAAAGRRARILPVPIGPAVGAAQALSRLGIEPPVSAAMLRRFLETRSFDISAARKALGFSPRPFAEGVRLAMERIYS